MKEASGQAQSGLGPKWAQDEALQLARPAWPLLFPLWAQCGHPSWYIQFLSTPPAARHLLCGHLGLAGLIAAVPPRENMPGEGAPRDPKSRFRALQARWAFQDLENGPPGDRV